MKINRNNYEIWMIDYFDGNLSAVEKSSFMAFLEANPDLKEEFELFDPSPVSASEISFTAKEGLKKQPILSESEINEDNYETYFINHFEKDLSAAEEKKLLAFLHKNPPLNDEFKIHEALLLESDLSVTYPNKEKLKRKSRIGLYWWPASVAASIVILFGIMNLLQNDANNPRTESIYISSLFTQNPDFGVSAEIDPELLAFVKPVVNSLALTSQLEPEIIEEITITAMPTVHYDLALTGNEIATYAPLGDYSGDEELAMAATPQKSAKKKNVLGKVIKNFAGRMSGNLPEGKKKEKDKNEPGFVKMLDQSITVFNTITGTDTELVKSYDEDGNLKHYHVEGETLSWSRNISAAPPGNE